MPTWLAALRDQAWDNGRVTSLVIDGKQQDGAKFRRLF